MERHKIVQDMVSVGGVYAMTVRDLPSLILKLLVISVKYISKKGLWATKFGDDHVDWKLLESLHNADIMGGCGQWMGILSFCNWDELHKSEGLIQASHTPLHTLRRNMKECTLDTGDEATWTHTCKIFLLMLMQGLPIQNALEVLTCDIFKRNTHAECMGLLAKQVHLDSFACVGYHLLIGGGAGRASVPPGAVRGDDAVCHGALCD